MAEVCLQSLYNINRSLARTTQLFQRTALATKHAASQIDFKKVCELTPAPEVEALTSQSSKLLLGKFECLMGKVSTELNKKQEEEHHLKLELEKRQHQVKVEVARQVTLQEPIRKDRMQQIERRRVFLTKALETLKAELVSGTPKQQITPAHVSSAKLDTASLMDTLAKTRAELQDQQQKVLEIEQKLSSLQNEESKKASLPAATIPSEAQQQSDLAATQKKADGDDRKAQLLNQLEAMRAKMQKLQDEKKDFESFKREKAKRIENMRIKLSAVRQSIPSAASPSACTADPSKEKRPSAPPAAAARDIDVKALLSFSRVLFPVQISSAVSFVMEMILNSKTVSRDGYRVVSKREVYKKLDGVWGETDPTKKVHLAKDTIRIMARRGLIAQDIDHVWEIRI